MKMKKSLIMAALLLLCLFAAGMHIQAAETQTESTTSSSVKQSKPKKKNNSETGWYTYNGKKYYVNSKGKMVTGWKKIGKYTYYFKKNGVMASAEWLKIDGRYYYFGPKGKMRNGWITIGKKKYYLGTEGVNPNKPMIALTFDDGPGQYTDRLLKCLEENNAVATFFVVGSSVSRYKNTVKKAYDMGCEIGNHSWNHPQLTTLDSASLSSQISSTNRAIRSATGHNPTLLRPPYGAYNSTVAAAVGMPMILWDVDTLDWKTRDVQSTINAVMSNAKDGSIILMHDIHLPTVIAAETIIPALKKKGYQLVTVSELAKNKRKQLKNGSAYSSVR